MKCEKYVVLLFVCTTGEKVFRTSRALEGIIADYVCLVNYMKQTFASI